MTRNIAGLALCAACIAAPAIAATGYSFKLDPATSSVKAKVSFMGLGHQKAQFPILSGKVSMPNSNGDKIDLDVKIDAARLTAGDKDMTKKLKGPDFFNVGKHPTVSFDGHRIAMTNATNAIVSGELTARGVTRPVKLAVTFSKSPIATNGKESIWLTGTTTINRKDFGMTAYSLVVGKNVTITIKSKLTPG